MTWRSAYERSSAPAQAEAGATGPGYVAKIEENLLKQIKDIYLKCTLLEL